MSKSELNNSNGSGKDLLRQVASAGPGYLGERIALSEEERATLMSRLQESKLDVPGYLEQNPEWVDREAKLFEAGSYPDKGIELSTDDLQNIAASFDLPVPILIEHARSPLELGYLTRVWCEEKNLMGTVVLTTEADALVRQSGAGSLSIGLSSDLKQLVEVSLVRHPRIRDARLFSRKLRGFIRTEVDPMAAESAMKLVTEGKPLTPHQTKVLGTLVGQLVNGQFASGASLISMLKELVSTIPSAPLTAEVAPSFAESEHPLFLPEEAAFFKRYFPDIPLDTISR